MFLSSIIYNVSFNSGCMIPSLRDNALSSHVVACELEKELYGTREMVVSMQSFEPKSHLLRTGVGHIVPPPLRIYECNLQLLDEIIEHVLGVSELSTECFNGFFKVRYFFV